MLKPVSDEMLMQLSQLIEQLTPEVYASPLDVFNGSSIGGHCRHVIEFYECLLAGAETGIVNYDERSRDMDIQQNRDYALATIKKIRIRMADTDYYGRPLQLSACFGDHQVTIPTNWEREEVYMIEHAIHHFALIRIGVQSVAPQLKIASGFGVAFSTIAFYGHKATESTDIACAY
jgi:hypothetical protein